MGLLIVDMVSGASEAAGYLRTTAVEQGCSRNVKVDGRYIQDIDTESPAKTKTNLKTSTTQTINDVAAWAAWVCG